MSVADATTPAMLAVLEYGSVVGTGEAVSA
jgi:hypothetical protein